MVSFSSSLTVARAAGGERSFQTGSLFPSSQSRKYTQEQSRKATLKGEKIREIAPAQNLLKAPNGETRTARDD
jgi:hypothetical protein